MCYQYGIFVWIVYDVCLNLHLPASESEAQVLTTAPLRSCVAVFKACVYNVPYNLNLIMKDEFANTHQSFSNVFVVFKSPTFTLLTTAFFVDNLTLPRSCLQPV